MTNADLVPVYPFSDFYIHTIYGEYSFNRLDPEYDEDLQPEDFELITRDTVESQFGTVEAQAIDSETGTMVVWTSTKIVYIDVYDGLESLCAVPRHPLLPEDAGRYHQTTYQKWLRGLKEAREFPPTFAQYCRAEEVNPFTGKPWLSNQ